MSTSSNVGADPASASFEIRDHLKSINPKADIIGANHNSPAPIASTEGEGENNDNLPKDDPATMAASEELKHTTISDKHSLPTESETPSQVPETEAHTTDKDSSMSGTDKDTTPEAESTDAQDEEMRDRISSPKKKRGRDQDDDTNLEESGKDNGSNSEGSLNGSRTMRSGPEKKRPRDTSQEPSRISDKSLAKVNILSFYFAHRKSFNVY